MVIADGMRVHKNTARRGVVCNLKTCNRDLLLMRPLNDPLNVQQTHFTGTKLLRGQDDITASTVYSSVGNSHRNYRCSGTNIFLQL
ncbi:MAG: hypothetical protein UZ17_ACD001001753 [Acidobacteria bacterium OLB17]|nr:MAG: hypothetical protein UZ17_ACD001001753 [Acidobacteria bacterium OLB17]